MCHCEYFLICDAETMYDVLSPCDSISQKLLKQLSTYPN